MIAKIEQEYRRFKDAFGHYVNHEDGSIADHVAWVRTQNVRTDDPRLAWKVMAYTAISQSRLKETSGQSQAGRKLEKPVFSFSLSWHPEQKPSRKHVLATAHQALEHMGLKEHEAVILARRDKLHSHVHVIANRVHPSTGVAADIHHSKRRMSDFSNQYERHQSAQQEQSQSQEQSASSPQQDDRLQQNDDDTPQQDNTPRLLFEKLAQMKLTALRDQHRQETSELNHQQRERIRLSKKQLARYYDLPRKKAHVQELAKSAQNPSLWNRLTGRAKQERQKLFSALKSYKDTHRRYSENLNSIKSQCQENADHLRERQQIERTKQESYFKHRRQSGDFSIKKDQRLSHLREGRQQDQKSRTIH